MNILLENLLVALQQLDKLLRELAVCGLEMIYLSLEIIDLHLPSHPGPPSGFSVGYHSLEPAFGHGNIIASLMILAGCFVERRSSAVADAGCVWRKVMDWGMDDVRVGK